MSMGRGIRSGVGVFVVIAAALIGLAANDEPQSEGVRAIDREGTRLAADRVDATLVAFWKSETIDPLRTVDDFRVARRLSLALVGTIPSLEEIRMLESMPPETRLERWVDHLLADRRFAEYFAERLARGMVPDLPVEPFFTYRRRRLVAWLADQLASDRPYDALVREILTAEGLWTDHPATNFVTAHERDPKRLASRATRAFLGLRIDCAECHDHPFADWKQTDFEGLAAYFGAVELGMLGIHDRPRDFTVRDPGAEEDRIVPAAVPFQKDLVADAGRRRERLARWITHSENEYFARALCNRVWRLLFGRAIIEPVDDLQGAESVPGLLDVLGEDFSANGYDIKRLLRILASTEAFRRRSAVDQEISDERIEETFAAFPVTRLRPEQVAGALAQSARLRVIDRESALLVRLLRVATEKDFVERYGDPGAEELAERTGNITQRLLMMNGKVATERTKAGPFNASWRICKLAPTDEACVRACYLVYLTRQPSDPELKYFMRTLEGTRGDPRERIAEDLCWALINSTEFSWNH